MNWLITGGCGFLGTALISELSKKGGHNIRVLDNLSTGTRSDLKNVSNYSELKLPDIDGGPLGVE